MFNPKYTYLLLDIAVIFFPLILSFDKKVAFYKTWKALFLSIFIVGSGFIIWDLLFTKFNVWQFNPEYICGIYFYNLPIEECLFFLVVPYSSVFIYECIRVYFKNYLPSKLSDIITVALIIINLAMMLFGFDKMYTLVNSCLLIIILVYIRWINKWHHLNLFYAAFIVCLLPFAICNGILTSWPILIYNNSQNLSIRMGTIPVEDLFYNFNMIILWCFFYEKFRYTNKANAKNIQ